jgi:Reverse transcriptase (RNA-dependent DNA polymerase).
MLQISRLEEEFFNKARLMDDMAIIAKTQEELQVKVNRLVDTRRKYGMKININKSQVMRVSSKVGNRELKEHDHFKYLESMLTRDGYCTREIKTRIAMAKNQLIEKYHS